MRDGGLDILQVSTADELGGAERVAMNLHGAYRAAGRKVELAVGRRRSRESGVVEIRHDAVGPSRQRTMWRLHHAMQPRYGSSRWARFVARASHRLAAPDGKRDEQQGLENFDYPGSWRLLDRWPTPPRVIQLHNLHGGYFDLRALPMLAGRSRQVLTLHDAWLLAGHCAHSLGCDRWRTGCGACPDLSIYPSIRKDATAENWRRKCDIFSRCELFVATPSHWLMRRVEQSMLWPAVRESRVIPNGIDTSVFHPGEQSEARQSLGLPPDTRVLLFAGLGGAANRFKDVQTLRAAAEQVATDARGQSNQAEVNFVVLGEKSSATHLEGAAVRSIPFEADARRVADWYRAADVYVHAAHADTFPNTVLEAQACGTPVVATAVGGIVEQVAPLSDAGGVLGASAATATGILTPPQDAAALAAGIKKLLTDDGLRRRLAVNGVERVRACYRLSEQASRYMAWFDEIAAAPVNAIAREARQRVFAAAPRDEPVSVQRCEPY